MASFPVVIDVTGSPSGLYGGTSANVAITIKKLVGVVVVPTTAITYDGNTTSVKVSENGTTTSRPITIGIASGGETQVVSGLDVGDKVVVPVLSFRGGFVFFDGPIDFGSLS